MGYKIKRDKADNVFSTAHPALHYEWQVETKGQKVVDEIILWSGHHKRKDREMDFLYWSQRLKEF